MLVTKETSLVILAGGRSSRMGVPKGLIPYRGRPWILEQIERASRAGVGNIVVVLGHEIDAYRGLPPGVMRAVNPTPERGQFSSIQCGIRAAGAGPVFVLPVDVPAPEPQTWAALCDEIKESVMAAIPVHGTRGGHPVLLSAELTSRILEEENGRLDLRLAGLGDRVKRVSVDDVAVTWNLNTPSDFENLART